LGHGTFPGVLALTVYSCGELGKLYAEAIKNIDPGPKEALDSTGSSIFKTIRWAIMPHKSWVALQCLICDNIKFFNSYIKKIKRIKQMKA
jgi:ABC-type phosphate/phosphonate transport system permease subunit